MDLTLLQAEEQLKNRPEDCELYLAKGLALHREGRVGEAREAFSQGLALNPFHVLLRQQRGRKYMATQVWQALSDFAIVIRLDPSYWEGWYYMGVAYCFIDSYEQALHCFTRCLQEAAASRASLVPVVDWLYVVHSRLNDAAGARQALTHVTGDADPKDEEYAYARRIMLYQGRLTPADFFDRETMALRGSSDIDFVTQAYGLANWYAINGDMDASNELLREIVQHDQHPTAFAWIMASRDLKGRGFDK